MVKDMESIGTLFSQSWTNYRGNFNKFMALIGIYFLPWLAMGLIVVLFRAANYLLENNTLFLVVVNILLALLMIVALVFGLVIYFSAQAAIFILVQKPKTKMSVVELFYEGKKHAWDYFILGILVMIFIFLWSLLFVFPGFIFMIYYSVAFWVLFVEGKKGREAIKRSKSLVKDYWWAVFWRIFIITFLVWFLLILPVYFIESKEALEAWRSFSNLINIFLSPFLVIYSYYIYKDLLRVKTGK